MGRNQAVIIGIDNYPSSPLNGCVSDAEAIAKLLSSHYDLSKNFDVELVTSTQMRVDRSTLREKVVQAFSGKAHIALFYFSGHGYIEQSGGFLVTQDHERYDQGLSMDEIINVADSAHQRIANRIIILDCCHSGFMGGNNFGENIATLREGTTIMTASRKSEAAVEELGGGLFTSLVIDALNGGAADLLGNVSPGMIYAHVDRSLGAFEQRPIFRTNVEEFVPLRKAEPPISLSKLQKITELFSSADFQYKLDPSYEFTSGIAEESKVIVLKLLQEYCSLNLVAPEDGENVPLEEKGHMYFAAINSRTCHLTRLGKHYYNLRRSGRF